MTAGVAVEPTVGRAMYGLLEPIHAMIYFAPEAQEEYAALGLEGTAEGYFPSRAAPLGRVPWQVVQATFFGFSPLAVQFGMTHAWEKTTPEAVLAARFRGVDRALRRMAGDLLDDVQEALSLVERAAAGCRPEGRPLYAAHTTVPAPPEPHLALWHTISLLREFRGDGHLVALLTAGLTGPQAVVLNGAVHGAGMTTFLQNSRAWTPQEWDAAARQLESRGWLDAAGELTEEGRVGREAIEEQTDVLALPAWKALGRDGCDRLGELLGPMSQAIVDAGGLPVPRRRT